MQTAFLVSLVVFAAALLILLWRVVRMTQRLEVAQESADQEGEEASVGTAGKHPLTTLSRFGSTSDPLNIKVIGTAEQLIAAFLSAGWYRADRIRVFSSLRLSIATVFSLRYSSAPISNHYLFGRKQDYAFQKPGRHARERDHVRFWDTGERAADGRPIWVGGATRDVNVDISPRTKLITHRIDSNVDNERATVMADLCATGGVIEQAWESGFGRRVNMINAMGYPFFSDGRITVLTLADVAVLLPVEVVLRGPTGGRVAGRLTRLFEWLLPRSGRRRAREDAQRHADAAAGASERASVDAPQEQAERERPPVGV